MSKLDKETRKMWDDRHPGQNLFDLPEIFDFLEERIQSLMSYDSHMEKQKNICAKKERFDNKRLDKRSNVGQTSQSGDTSKRDAASRSGTYTKNYASGKKCICCKKDDGHYIVKCPTFLAMTIEQRRDFVKVNNLCYNCLASDHYTGKCKSTYKCRECKGTHHTMLHRPLPQNTNPRTNVVQQNEEDSPSEDENAPRCGVLSQLKSQLQVCQAVHRYVVHNNAHTNDQVQS